MNYEVRAPKTDELNAMFRCFASTMRPHVEAAFGWDEGAVREKFEAGYRSMHCEVFVVNSEFAGFAWVELNNEWHLSLLCIEPSFQDKGIGGNWLRALIGRAKNETKTIRLKIFKTNARAGRLYERSGFRYDIEDEHGFEMIFDGAAR